MTRTYNLFLGRSVLQSVESLIHSKVNLDKKYLIFIIFNFWNRQKLNFKKNMSYYQSTHAYRISYICIQIFNLGIKDKLHTSINVLDCEMVNFRLILIYWLQFWIKSCHSYKVCTQKQLLSQNNQNKHSVKNNIKGISYWKYVNNIKCLKVIGIFLLFHWQISIIGDQLWRGNCQEMKYRGELENKKLVYLLFLPFAPLHLLF